MAKKRANETAVYEVLIPCSRGDDHYDVGDEATSANFTHTVIFNWLKIDPPVLKLKGGK